MSTIETFYNATFINTRKTTLTPTSTDTTVTVSSFAGVKRPETEIAKLYVENNIGNEWDLYCDEDIDVRVGDDVYEGGTKYDVLGVMPFEDLEDDTDSYLKVRISR